MVDAFAEGEKIGGRWVLADWIAAARAELGAERRPTGRGDREGGSCDRDGQRNRWDLR